MNSGGIGITFKIVKKQYGYRPGQQYTSATAKIRAFFCFLHLIVFCPY